MKINLEKVTLTDLEGKSLVIMNARKAIANMIYQHGTGLECLALSTKMWNGNADTNYSKEELNIIRSTVNAGFVAAFIAVVSPILDEAEKEK